MPPMWWHRFQCPLLQTVSARAGKPTPRFPISTSENGYYRSHFATSSSMLWHHVGAPTAERTVGPARISLESLTPRPGIREQNLP